jgi:hypothetical protein
MWSKYLISFSISSPATSIMPISRRNSFIACLKDILQALCGSEESAVMLSLPILASYSAETFEFKGIKEGSEKVANTYHSKEFV